MEAGEILLHSLWNDILSLTRFITLWEVCKEKRTQQAEAERAAASKSLASQKGDSPESEFWLPQAVGNF